jgi:hypothetical protein
MEEVEFLVEAQEVEETQLSRQLGATVVQD